VITKVWCKNERKLLILFCLENRTLSSVLCHVSVLQKPVFGNACGKCYFLRILKMMIILYIYIVTLE